MGFTFTTNEHYFLTSLDIPPVHQQKNNPESNAIFAQNDNFTRGEEVSFSTSGNVDYELRVLGKVISENAFPIGCNRLD